LANESRLAHNPELHQAARDSFPHKPPRHYRDHLGSFDSEIKSTLKSVYSPRSDIHSLSSARSTEKFHPIVQLGIIPSYLVRQHRVRIAGWIAGHRKRTVWRERIQCGERCSLLTRITHPQKCPVLDRIHHWPKRPSSRNSAREPHTDLLRIRSIVMGRYSI
jgi:hypothetical protein